MPGFLDKSEINIPCPKCSRKTKKTIGWIKDHNEFTCVCGAAISLNTGKFKTQISKVEASVSDLKVSIKKLNK